MTDTFKKVWFIGINSSYIHTNPAIRSLADKTSAKWIEFNINQHKDEVLREIYLLSPDVAAFSCYIWNIKYALDIAENLKKIQPGIKIILGGPEVSYNATELIEKYAFVDEIICGEGESVISGAIAALYNSNIPNGVLLRRDNKILGSAKYNIIKNLDELESPFINYEYDPNKIYYYESSRGCPYSCAYCLSGDNISLRYKSLEKVKSDLELIISKNVRLIKFVDRTFNADRNRAYQILQYIIDNNIFENCRFHFEIGLDLLDERTLDLLARSPAKRIQLEAGIQTCNVNSLKLIARRTDTERALSAARFLTEQTDIELHLDLIAGLPAENFYSFKESFNRVYSVYPRNIQLGFLKVLYGTELRKYAEKYGIIFRSKPPYEVLATRDISPAELYDLKGISGLLDRYYNTGRAKNALNFLTCRLSFEPFDLYLGLYKYSVKHNWHLRPLSAPDQFRMLMDYAATILCENEYVHFLKKLKFDYLKVKIKGAMPNRLEEIRI